ncbi:ML3 [Symbiodinium sp. CCMP2592]|nr:ML3 [Symbiodinium sp. CCMP2592]
MAQQLPVRNTFIEVRAPAVIRPRSQTDFAPGPGSPVTKGIGAPVLAAAAAAPAAPPVAPVSACAVSSIETVASRRCSVIRTPDVLFPRTPLGSVSMEPPHGFALPQALDELQRRRTSTLSSEAARVQTSHSTTTRRSSLDMIPSTPDMYYSWPVDMNPAAFMLPSAAPPGPGQVAAAPVPLSTHCTKPQAQAAQAAAIGASERLAKTSAPLGNPSVTPVSWDTYAAPAPTAPTPLLVQDQKPLHNMPMWPPGHIQSTVLPSRYPMQHPQQVLVLSNFLQEAPPKMDELSAAHTDSQLYDSAALQPASGVTTLMLRNIPVTFNREALLADFDARGLRGKYDFFYLPIDFQTGNNLGYAFVNFVSPVFAEQFRTVYQGLALAGERSKKICAVAPATTQGRLANVEYYRNSPVMSMEEKYHPLVFENGVRQKFPAPTKAVKPIRFRESRGIQGE